MYVDVMVCVCQTLIKKLLYFTFTLKQFNFNVFHSRSGLLTNRVLTAALTTALEPMTDSLHHHQNPLRTVRIGRLKITKSARAHAEAVLMRY